MNTLLATRPLAKVQGGVQVRWREVALFTSLAYVFTWAWLGIKLAPHLDTLFTGSTTPTNSVEIFGHPLYHVVGMFGPMLAALIMRLTVSKEGLAGSLGGRRPWWQYLTSVLVPVAIFSVVSLIALMTGLAQFVMPDEAITWGVGGFFIVVLVFEVVVAFGEEYGWRGYLLPRLMPLGEIRASLMLGIIWSLWHLPVLLAGVLYPGSNRWLLVLLYCFSTTMVTFAYTWLAVSSRHSVLMASVFHGASNWTGNRLLTFLRIDNLLAVNLVMGVAWLVIVTIVYRVLNRSPHSALE